ncbi:MAG TPA: substrate-binding domain-containing protein [Streptosporangiaceae bacterium]|nr:substrate-binding domain-containing protein [Streptosporangiaceae bacterium]
MAGILAGVVAAGLIVALSVNAIVSRSSVSCTGHPVAVHVAAAEDIAPVLASLAQTFNAKHTMVDGHCATVSVAAQPPPSVAAQFEAGALSQDEPVSAWVPDSALWLDVARSTPTGQRVVPATGHSVAQTPLVLAMPGKAGTIRAVRGRTTTPGTGAMVGWQTVLPHADGGPPTALGLHIQIPDATESGAGLEAILTLRKVVGFGVNARAALARFFINTQIVPSPDGSAPSLDAMAHPASAPGAGVPLAITTEQTVIAFDRAHAQTPLAVRYPTKGTPALTYPYVVTTTDPAVRTAAQDFGAQLRSAAASTAAQAQGFRASSGALGKWPGSFGLATSDPTLLPSSGTGEAAKALQTWHALALSSRILSVMDVSSVMATAPVPGGPDLAHLLGRAAAAGLARVPDSAEMGLWAFADHLQGNLPYRPLVPVGPLPSPLGLITRRQAIQQYAENSRAAPTGAALYGTILDAYKYVNSTYEAGHINDVLMLTAGVENAPGDIHLAELVGALKALYNPQKPVEVIILLMGNTNTVAMDRIAAATNGKVFVITSPSQMPGLFFHVVGRRVCRPRCA